MYRVLLRKNDTGEERWFNSDQSWYDDSDFLWTEGNFSCDFNRANFFALAGGQEADSKTPCGTEQYTAVCAVTKDRRRYDLDTIWDGGPLMADG